MTAAIQTLLEDALAHQRRGDLAGAEAACRKALDIDADQPDALQFLGLIADARGDLGAAEELMVRSLEANPAQPHVLNNLANVLHKKDKSADALAALEKALELVPDYPDAWFNLGKIRFDLDDFDAAEEALKRAAENWPHPDPRPWMVLGNIRRQRGDFDAANRYYQQALEKTPNYFNALHNYGVSLKMQQRHGEALAVYQKAKTVNPNAPELYYNIANALYETGDFEGAVENYKKALALRPDFVTAHATLSEILWRQGQKDDYLESFRSAIEKAPTSRTLRTLFVENLLKAKQPREAMKEIEAIFSVFGGDAEAWHLQAKCHSMAKNGQDAERALKKAIELAPGDVEYRRDICKLYIKGMRFEDALDHIEHARETSPFNQEILAYLALCWRLCGDPRHRDLNDYETFVRPYIIPTPEGYASLAEFNAALNKALDKFHTSTFQPSDQTLRGGTQTIPALLDRNVKEIQELRKAFEKTIKRYLADLPDDPEHPFLSRKSSTTRFAGSWSVRLKGDGFHVNHTHPEGWISASYYVQLPEVVKKGKDHQGWIKFGESPLDLGSDEEIGKVVQPEEGLLVLFPSYMFHGTYPFTSDETRTTLPFDAVPG